MYRRKSYDTLKDYLNDACSELVFSAAVEYLNTHPEVYIPCFIPIHSDKAEDVVRCEITSLYTECEDDDFVFLDCKVSVDFDVFHIETDNVVTMQLWLYMKIKAKFIDRFSDFSVEKVCLADEAEPFDYKKAWTKCFVPYIRENTLEYYATKFLKKYCPEALTTPMSLPVSDILRKMKLKVMAEELIPEHFSRCYYADSCFTDVNGEIKKVKKGTIVYNTNSSFFYGIGSVNNTFIHECIHWEYHRRFFALLHLLRPELSSSICTILDRDVEPPADFAKEYDLMEWHSNALAPKILMPAATTKQKFEEILFELEIVEGLTGATLYIEAIKQLAKFFDVTVGSAKIRLQELGYTRIKGLYDYVNGAYTSPYYFDESKVPPHSTFSIGIHDAIEVVKNNPTIKKCVDEGRLLYVDGFFVVNHPKYVTRGDTGAKELTQYALEHMDECCLIFECKKNRNLKRRYYSLCFLSRDTSANRTVQRSLNPSSEVNASVIHLCINMETEQAERQEAHRTIRHMVGNFGECLEYLMSEGGFSCNSLKQESHVDDHKIKDYITGRNCRPAKKDVLAFCAAMNLHPIVSHEFLRRAGYDIASSQYDEDYCYSFLLTHFWEQGLDVWNDHILEYENQQWVLP